MTMRTGVTLVELIVVLALLSVVAAVTGLAFRRARPVVGLDPSAALVLAARDSALRLGRVVTLRVSALGARRSATATAFPDGRVIADSSLGIDPLSGKVAHAAR
jgi:prepilin-type N-terminal cleavage/methylation domain-containing protein